MSARELLAAATQRPWSYNVSGDGVYVNSGSFGVTFGYYKEPRGDADAALLVAAVNEYEALLDIADALRRYLDGHPQTEWDLVKDALARLDAGRAES